VHRLPPHHNELKPLGVIQLTLNSENIEASSERLSGDKGLRMIRNFCVIPGLVNGCSALGGVPIVS